MSEAVTGLLKLAFSFIRTKAAEKLQDGGLTDQKVCGWILRELDDITSKLDAISPDLWASISFLQKGINRLNMSVGASSESGNSDEKPSTNELLGAVRSSTETKSAPQSVMVGDAVELASAIGKPKVESRFQLAKKSFEEAVKEATRVFHNAALSTEDRILAIKEIFSVHIQGGIKSLFKKDSRTEIVETVTMINLILADFISKFTKQRMAVFDWPTIVCDKRVVHPIHFNKESLPNLSEMKITPPWDIVELEDDEILTDFYSRTMALTKNGDLVCVTEGKHGPQKLVKTTGKLQPHCHSALEGDTEYPQPRDDVICLTVDEDDTVYVLSRGRKLSVYSADGRNMHHSILTFSIQKKIIGIRIKNNKDIVIVVGDYDPSVYVCNRNGGLINSFDLEKVQSPMCFFMKSNSSNDEIVLMTQDINNFSNDTYRLFTYTQDGKFQGTVKFLPNYRDFLFGSPYANIFYNHVTKTIIGQVASYNEPFIEYLSDETGELQCSYLLHNTNFPETETLRRHSFHLVCHINGTMALVVSQRYVIFLKNPSPST